MRLCRESLSPNQKRASIIGRWWKIDKGNEDSVIRTKQARPFERKLEIPFHAGPFFALSIFVRITFKHITRWIIRAHARKAICQRAFPWSFFRRIQVEFPFIVSSAVQPSCRIFAYRSSFSSTVLCLVGIKAVVNLHQHLLA